MKAISQIAEPRLKKTLLSIMTAAVAALYIISLGLGIVYSSVSNNIVYMNSALMYVIEIGLQLLDLALYSVAFSFFVFAVYRYGFRASVSFFVSYAVLTALRRVFSLLFELLFSGAIGTDDVSSVLIYFALDIITAAVVIAIIAYEFQKYNHFLKEWKKIQRDLGKNQTPPALCPFEKLFTKNNPLQVCAIKIGILLSGAKILSRIIFDIYYGAPTGFSEVLIMIIYYLSDILIGVLVYAAMFWLFGLLSKLKATQKEEETEAS